MKPSTRVVEAETEQMICESNIGISTTSVGGGAALGNTRSYNDWDDDEDLW